MKPEVEDWMIGHNGRWDEDDVHLKNPNTPGFGRMKSHPFLVIFWMIAFIEFTTLLWLMLFLVKGNFPYRWIFSEWICDDMWYSRTKYPHWMFLRVKEALLDAVSTSHHSPHTWGSHVELIWFILGIVPLTGDLGCCGYSLGGSVYKDCQVEPVRVGILGGPSKGGIGLCRCVWLKLGIPPATSRFITSPPKLTLRAQVKIFAGTSWLSRDRHATHLQLGNAKNHENQHQGIDRLHLSMCLFAAETHKMQHAKLSNGFKTDGYSQNPAEQV